MVKSRQAGRQAAPARRQHNNCAGDVVDIFMLFLVCAMPGPQLCPNSCSSCSHFFYTPTRLILADDTTVPYRSVAHRFVLFVLLAALQYFCET